MNILILPGGGNPAVSELYRNVYGLIEELATAEGASNVISDLRWPGQTTNGRNFSRSPFLTFPHAVAKAKRKIRHLPPGPYTILGRSFGCYVALKLACRPDRLARPPAKLMLWGPTPHWLLWELFMRDLHINRLKARQKGLKIDRRFYSTIEPVESLLQSVRVPTVLAAGSKDQYCSPAFLAYLKKLAAVNPMVSFAGIVKGAPHEVTKACGNRVIRSYKKTLFG